MCDFHGLIWELHYLYQESSELVITSFYKYWMLRFVSLLCFYPSWPWPDALTSGLPYLQGTPPLVWLLIFDGTNYDTPWKRQYTTKTIKQTKTTDAIWIICIFLQKETKSLKYNFLDCDLIHRIIWMKANFSNPKLKKKKKEEEKRPVLTALKSNKMIFDFICLQITNFAVCWVDNLLHYIFSFIFIFHPWWDFAKKVLSYPEISNMCDMILKMTTWEQ